MLLSEQFKKEIAPQLMKKMGVTNRMLVPKLDKIVVNVSTCEALINPKVLDTVVAELSQITGQRPVIRKAKKSIANFKLREGQAIGASVTLRNQRMYDFFNRLVNLALPRTRDFKGCSKKSFDGHGNYTLGVAEQIIFPEILQDKVDKVRGMNITIATTAKTDKEAKELLVALGFPFRS